SLLTAPATTETYTLSYTTLFRSEILYATPHVWPHLVLGEERERNIRAAFVELRSQAPLELRLGFELTPAPPLLADDPARYALERSEEHTSELQSLRQLVCRLLLE